jgi:hypothetical protein
MDINDDDEAYPRQTRSACDDLWPCGLTIHDDRWPMPYARGIHVCFFSFLLKAEMSFSYAYLFETECKNKD